MDTSELLPLLSATDTSLSLLSQCKICELEGLIVIAPPNVDVFNKVFPALMPKEVGAKSIIFWFQGQIYEYPADLYSEQMRASLSRLVCPASKGK